MINCLFFVFVFETSSASNTFCFFSVFAFSLMLWVEFFSSFLLFFHQYGTHSKRGGRYFLAVALVDVDVDDEDQYFPVHWSSRIQCEMFHWTKCFSENIFSSVSRFQHFLHLLVFYWSIVNRILFCALVWLIRCCCLIMTHFCICWALGQLNIVHSDQLKLILTWYLKKNSDQLKLFLVWNLRLRLMRKDVSFWNFRNVVRSPVLRFKT